MKKGEESKRISKQDVLELYEKDKNFAQELFCELYIYYHYNEKNIGVDVQSYDMPMPIEGVNPVNCWFQNLKYRILSILRAHGMSIQMSVDELESIIEEIQKEYPKMSVEFNC